MRGAGMNVTIGDWISYCGEYWLVDYVDCGWAWISNPMTPPKRVSLEVLREVSIDEAEFETLYKEE